MIRLNDTEVERARAQRQSKQYVENLMNCNSIHLFMASVNMEHYTETRAQNDIIMIDGNKVDD